MADVLYFATHGVLKDDDPNQSFVALAKAPGQDGRLRVADIYRMKIHARLVILAACRTGAGQVTGDGVNGLVRAFTFAGSSNLISSLWSAPEKQTSELMGWFHQYWLQEGKSVDQALRAAQLQRLKLVTDQPNVWAGIVYYGINEASK
jgi:CHAT domain-containing protein